MSGTVPVQRGSATAVGPLPRHLGFDLVERAPRVTAERVDAEAVERFRRVGDDAEVDALLVAVGATIAITVWLFAREDRKEKVLLSRPPGVPVADRPAGIGRHLPVLHPIVRLAPAHPGAVRGVTFGAGGRLLAVGGGNEVTMWDVTDPAYPRQTVTLTEVAGATVTSVGISPDATVVAVGSGQ